MVSRRQLPTIGAVALALLMAAAPVYAQGKGNSGRDQADKQDTRGQPQGKAKAQARDNSQGRSNAQARGNSQGKGKAQTRDHAQGRGNTQGGGNAQARSNAGRGARGRDAASLVPNDRRNQRFRHTIRVDELHPRVRSHVRSDRLSERLAGAAAALAFARGADDDDIIIRQNGQRWLLQNDDGVTLIDLDDARARDLGAWHVDPWDQGVKSGAPSFCASGEGHPVWGRSWCLDKGFGLGDYRDLRWGRTRDVGDIIFRRMDSGTLARAALLGVLGDVVFNRLGLHALTLGYTEPLTGNWLGEPTGPQVLLITSGGVPIAEFYDADRDRRADELVVALRPW